jgi:hypothetical protein
MNIEQIKEIADAILYEGYLLYPYRHSALKNRQRWTFGVIYPRTYSERQGGRDPWLMQTECLVSAQTNTTLRISVRFLHLLMQTRTKAAQVMDTWDEGMAREIIGEQIPLQALTTGPYKLAVSFPGNATVSTQMDGLPDGETHLLQPLTGTVTIAATPTDHNVFKLRVTIENTSPQANVEIQRRDAILLQSFISTHTILQVLQGSFISLLDPPAELTALAQSCQNLHTWPVLIGDHFV